MKQLRQTIFILVATSIGLGYAPIAPGTVGTLPAIVIYVVIVLAAPPELQPWLIALALLVVCFLTVALSPWAERYWKKKDPKNFVTDEVAGFLATVLLFRAPNLWLTVIGAFVVTRIADILKPPPCRQLERLPRGWGILADDLMASVYAAGLLHIMALCFPEIFGLPI
ncbi:MAG: phosphatidylglycerophosphatase A family protein [Planctomycetota bacterium]|jgi:phosphatidylglycerophosphatase A